MSPDARGPRKPSGRSRPSVARIAQASELVIASDGPMLVASKPAGLASQGGRGLTDSMIDLMQALAPNPDKPVRLVHRLDRETSGVMVFARTRSEAARLSELFAGRAVTKAYLALVAGDFGQDSRVIATPLKPLSLPRAALVQRAEPGDPEAQEAHTHVEPLATSTGASLVLARPQTGRMHQIRVHLAEAGHPLLGDGAYAGPLAVAGLPVVRMMLHAWWLELPDRDGESRRWSAPLPDDFTILAAVLGLAVPDLGEA